MQLNQAPLSTLSPKLLHPKQPCMTSELGSSAMASSVSQCLLRAIGSENTFLLERDLEALFQVDKAVDQVKLRAGISEAVELVKQRLHSSIATAHRYHNTLLPIKKLPSELLSTTIGHAMAEVDCYNYQERLIQLSGVHRGGAP